METRRKILIAMRQEGVVAAERALGGYAELVPAYSYGDAIRQLQCRSDISLVLCGMYFDETRMFDLLRFVKENYPALRFVCCRVGQTEVPQVTLEAVAIAAKSMGAVEFVDVPLLRSDHAADQEFRSLVLRHVR